MKKSLIALAVLAASGVASAQSTVTLYGLLDGYLGSVKDKTTVNGVSTSLRQTVINSGGFNTSRFGLKGSEDLGGGLKANFLLESGFDISTGAANNYVNPYTGASSTAVFGRQSWAGVSGGFGEIKLGKMWTPFDDVKGSGAAAFDANIFAPANNVWLSNNYQDRPGNAIYYATPDFSGFSAAAMYSLGENKTAAASAGKIASVNVKYAAGPAFVALSHQEEKATGTGSATKFTQLNGSWDFGVAKLLGAYGQVKNGSTTLFATAPATFLAVDKSKEYQLGVDVPVGAALTLSGGVARSKITLAAAGGEIKATGFGLAAKYDVSKRTFLYTGLQLSKNKFASSEVKTDTYAVGVQHKF
ncbi:porin [Polaromonas sp.]|uniref:porin n=1 Tax=Polaromonas sp. TaxID=1869339 RepID=UPI0017ABAF7C|nr:porin [Polaromonas sp.]NMM08262.1 porin [Polaromonas sp.]